MAFPAVTNVDGSNPGPAVETLPEPVTMPIGNIGKIGSFTLTLSPASVANAATAEQTFTFTGMLATDYVGVNKPTAQSGLGIVGSRAGAGFIGITFANVTAATITPTSAESYRIFVARVLPNFTQAATGAVMDW